MSRHLIPQLGLWRLRHKTAQSHLFPVTLTPGGGCGSPSGTKNVPARGSPGAARYFSKSVTPSPARKESSIRKRPVKLFARLRKIACAESFTGRYLIDRS